MKYEILTFLQTWFQELFSIMVNTEQKKFSI